MDLFLLLFFLVLNRNKTCKVQWISISSNHYYICIYALFHTQSLTDNVWLGPHFFDRFWYIYYVYLYFVVQLIHQSAISYTLCVYILYLMYFVTLHRDLRVLSVKVKCCITYLYIYMFQTQNSCEFFLLFFI